MPRQNKRWMQISDVERQQIFFCFAFQIECQARCFFIRLERLKQEIKMIQIFLQTGFHFLLIDQISVSWVAFAACILIDQDSRWEIHRYAFECERRKNNRICLCWDCWTLLINQDDDLVWQLLHANWLCLIQSNVWILTLLNGC